MIDSIYRFTDYRAFLRAWLAARRSRSQRGLAQRLDVTHSFVSMIVKGKRNLGLSDAKRWAEALRLDPDEASYFEAMIRAAHAPTEAMRRAAQHQLSVTRDFHHARPVEGHHSDLLGTWYTPVILEMMHCEGFREDPAWIAERIVPPISADEVQEALRLVEETGAATRDAGGVLRPDPRHFATERMVGDQDVAAFIYRAHRTTMEHAAACLDLPADERFVSSVTVAIDRERLPELTDLLTRLQLEASEAGRSRGARPDQVYQICLQVFPRTARLESGTEEGPPEDPG